MVANVLEVVRQACNNILNTRKRISFVVKVLRHHNMINVKHHPRDTASSRLEMRNLKPVEQERYLDRTF